MSFTKKTIKDIDVNNKTVLLRVDYNVLNDQGQVTEDYRIKASKPTVDHLLKHNCKVVLVSHAGRPEGKRVEVYSLQHVVKRVSAILGQPVRFVNDCVGPGVESKVQSLKSKDILLLENTRFHPEEEKNDADFAKRLASLADVFVQDGFGNAHRQHASMAAITRFIPSVAGLLLEKEVSTITEAMENPKRPLVVIVGGAKVSDKIELLKRFVKMADKVLVGGAMANTFLKHDGCNIGKSKFEPGQDAKIESIYKEVEGKIKQSGEFGVREDYFVVPRSKVAVAKKIDKAERRSEVYLNDVGDDDVILDIEVGDILEAVAGAGTVIWNGPVGMTELPQFAEGSNQIAAGLKQSKATSIIGGGDTAAFILDWDPDAGKYFDLVSTGGGASLELMAGKKLPGVEALQDK